MSIRIICIILLFTSLSFSQENGKNIDSSSVSNIILCEHPILKKAQSQGLNSLTFKEIPIYWYKSWQCKRLAKKAGKDIDFKSLYIQKMEENYTEAKELSGIGSCGVTFIAVILFYSYYEYLAGAK